MTNRNKKIQSRGYSGAEVNGETTLFGRPLEPNKRNCLFVVVSDTEEHARELIEKKALPNPVLWSDHVIQLIKDMPEPPPGDDLVNVEEMSQHRYVGNAVRSWCGRDDDEKITLILDTETIMADHKAGTLKLKPLTALTFLARDFWTYSPDVGLEVNIRNAESRTATTTPSQKRHFDKLIDLVLGKIMIYGLKKPETWDER